MVFYVFLCRPVCGVFVPAIFVMVPLNMTYLHYLQHSFFEHLFNLYCNIIKNITCFSLIKHRHLLVFVKELSV